MISKLFSIAMAATLAAIPAASASGQVPQLDAGHQAIVEAAARAGVPVSVNPILCSQHTMDGFYNGHRIGICTPNEQWSANDLDTLRHEAQYLVQDCLGDGRPNFTYNGRFTTFYDVPLFARQVLTLRELQMIAFNYHDADHQTMLMELEAWAVAKAVAPEAIAEGINNHCRA